LAPLFTVDNNLQIPRLNTPRLSKVRMLEHDMCVTPKVWRPAVLCVTQQNRAVNVRVG
jgi:hypothetical protein